MIRPARPDDVPVILHLIEELARYEREPDAVDTTEAMLTTALFGSEPKVFAHLAEDAESGVAGVAIWYVTFSTWTGRHGIWLEDLFVLPDRRGHGYGLALLKTLAAIAVERGYKRVEWNVLDWNEPAIAFYDSIGARPLDGWTTNRLTGAALGDLAGFRPDAG